MVFSATAQEMIVAVIFPLKPWNILIILYILENTHIIFQIREKCCSNNWADLSKWMTHMKASHIYIRKSPWVSGSPKKENEIGSLHELKSFLTHDLQICSKIASWKCSFGSHDGLLEATNWFLYLKTNTMVSPCLSCWKFQNLGVEH